MQGHWGWKATVPYLPVYDCMLFIGEVMAAYLPCEKIPLQKFEKAKKENITIESLKLYSC